MDGLVRTVGNGIAGVMATGFEVIGATLRWMVGSASNALPGFTLPIVVFGLLVAIAWVFARR
jgi:hypothetical protein